MRILSVSMIVLGLSITSTWAQGRPADMPRQIYGKVRVLDGTTFEFVKSRQTVRLAGYEAPRLAQTANSDGVEWPVGQVSRAWMILRTLGQDVNCAPIARGSNQMTIAHCFVGETNLAATAIAEGIGYAYNYPGEPHVPAYFDIERRARGLGYGVWSASELSPPWLFDVAAAAAKNAAAQAPLDAGLPLPLPIAPESALPMKQAHGG